jgi:hypothetical protein
MEVYTVTRKFVFAMILLLSILVNSSTFAHKKVIVVKEDKKVVRIKKDNHRADKVIIVRDRRPDTVIVERRVVVRRVERPVIVREVVEPRVVVYERQPVIVNRPVVVPSASCATFGFSTPVRIGGIHAIVSFSSTSCGE